MRKISVYADGSSTGNSTGACGWGWLIIDWTNDSVVKCGMGGAPTGTNNIAELQAAIHGLRDVKDSGLHVDAEITLVSDSMYCLGLADGRYVAKAHVELVKSLRKLVIDTGAKTQWVKGHSGDAFNERVDELAKMGRDQYTVVEPRKRRRSRKREERRRKRRLVKEYKRRVYG